MSEKRDFEATHPRKERSASGRAAFLGAALLPALEKRAQTELAEALDTLRTIHDRVGLLGARTGNVELEIASAVLRGAAVDYQTGRADTGGDRIEADAVNARVLELAAVHYANVARVVGRGA